MTKSIDDLLDDIGVEEYSNKIDELEKTVWKLRKTLEAYGITEEAHISNVEYICQKGIEDLKNVERLTQDDAKILDLLHKNLRQARGNLEKKEAPGKATTEAELLRIVKGGKK